MGASDCRDRSGQESTMPPKKKPTKKKASKDDLEPLSTRDQKLLASYEQQQQIVVDRTTFLLNRRHNAFFCWGETGIGKSHNIRQTLLSAQNEGLRAVKFLTGRCTEPGLLDVIQENPDYVIFIDDDPKLIGDSGAQRTLLHMCDRGQKDPKTGKDTRLITDHQHKKQTLRPFTGQVIITANKRLQDMPILQALSSRIQTYHFHPSQEELTAKLRHLAVATQHDGVSLAERQEVCEFVISECRHSHQRIHLRMLTNAVQDFAAWKSGEGKTHWKMLVTSSLKDYFGMPPQVSDPPLPLTRAERKKVEQEQICQLIETKEHIGTRDDVKTAWMKLTGKKPTPFYNRLKELSPEWQRRYHELDDKQKQRDFELTQDYVLDSRDHSELDKRPVAKRSVVEGAPVTPDEFYAFLKTMTPEARDWFNSLSD